MSDRIFTQATVVPAHAVTGDKPTGPAGHRGAGP